MFTDVLTTDEMIAIVVAAPPNTAVHHAVNGGWTTTDHLLATAVERDAGLVDMRQRLARPGVTDTRPSTPPRINHDKPVQKLGLDVMTIQEFEARLRAHTQGA